MPFVTVMQNPVSPIKYDPQELERICKEAWVAMRKYSDECYDAGPFEATDVGGLMAENKNVMTEMPGSCILLFYYTGRRDRTILFREDLRRELQTRLPEDIGVILIPTSAWFTNPIWAVKEVEVDSANDIQI